jgi:hypothetical protein
MSITRSLSRLYIKTYMYQSATNYLSDLPMSALRSYKRKTKSKPLRAGDVELAHGITFQESDDGKGGSKRIKVPIKPIVPTNQSGDFIDPANNAQDFDTLFDQLGLGEDDPASGAGTLPHRKVC